jgi:hypothetical protein
LNLQTSLEDAKLLGGHHSEWSFGACNQLYFDVVSSSDQRDNI